MQSLVEEREKREGSKERLVRAAQNFNLEQCSPFSGEIGLEVATIDGSILEVLVGVERESEQRRTGYRRGRLHTNFARVHYFKIK
ncbi:unnamed protein product [Camellia sinensis]